MCRVPQRGMLRQMGCLFAIFAGFFPRVVLVAVWIFTDDVDRAFSGFVVPLLGVIFLPLTTLVYVLLWQSGHGVHGVEWLWVVLAFIADLGSAAGGESQRRQRAATA
jgi:hypothetical protein